MTFLRRDQLEVEALVTDRYLESLLLAQDRRAGDTPADPSLDPGIRSAARRLARDLGRVHPSFRFEERLAARLAEVASRMRLAEAAGGEGQPMPVAPLVELPDEELRALGLQEPGQTANTGVPRPILIGGAITSAAISLAGAAFVAWRLTHPPSHPMTRAARKAHAGGGRGRGRGQARTARRRPVSARLD